MTDHLSLNTESGSVQELFSTIRDDLQSGIAVKNIQSFNNQLIKQGLLAKAAQYYSDSNSITAQIPTQWLKPNIQKLVIHALDLGFEELILEFAIFLTKQQIPFPADILIPLLNYSNKNLDFASKIIHCLGPKGQFLTDNFDQWALFKSIKAETIFTQTKKEQRIFNFRRYRHLNPQDAFYQFCQYKNQIKTTEFPDYLFALKKHITSDEWISLKEFGNHKSKTLQYSWTVLKLNLRSAEFENEKIRFLMHFAEGLDFSKFCYFSPQNKAYQWPIDLLISCIPPEFVLQEQLQVHYFNFIIKHSLEKDFLKSMALFSNGDCANAFFNFALKKNLLTEGFPVAALFKWMDHESFNENCIQWIDFCGDDLDVEALLQACLLQNQYWSDELCIKIIELRKSGSLSESYDFDAFWQLLPFKINPSSSLISKIPDECKFFGNIDFNFNAIIQFRKWLRSFNRLIS